MSALSALHATKNNAPIDEDAFRDICERVTSQRSTKAMSDKQRWMVVDELKRLYPALKLVSKPRPDGRKKLTGAYAKKLQALWIAAWNLGIVDNRDDAALLAFVKRQTKLDHTRFLRHPEDANRAIEALKAWIAREADVDWSVGALTADFARPSGYKIAFAQATKLNNLEQLTFECAKALNADPHAGAAWRLFAVMTDKHWILVMNALGDRIREKKAAA